MNRCPPWRDQIAGSNPGKESFFKINVGSRYLKPVWLAGVTEPDAHLNTK